MKSPLSICIAVIVCLAASTLVGIWRLSSEDPRLLESAEAGPVLVPETRAEEDNGPAPLMVATTPEELRQVVQFCRTADRSAVPVLRRNAVESADPLVAGNAIRALGRLRVLTGDQRILKLLEDERPRVRHELVIALGHSRDPSHIADLEPFLTGEDTTARRLAIQALGRIGGPEAKSKLQAILEKPGTSAEDLAFARAALRACNG